MNERKRDDTRDEAMRIIAVLQLARRAMPHGYGKRQADVIDSATQHIAAASRQLEEFARLREAEL